MARRSGRATRVDEPFEDRGLDFSAVAFSIPASVFFLLIHSALPIVAAGGPAQLGMRTGRASTDPGESSLRSTSA